MSDSPRHELADLLARRGTPEDGAGGATPGAASAVVRTEVPDLWVEVDGVGPIEFPVPAEQAQALAVLGRPARYGRGEETLTDPSVRDTWEIPPEAVHVDWDGALEEVLDEAREELGLGPDRWLTAEFHSMLVYGEGQFFLPHQDSEKHDAMVATLVVMLPSVYTGGALVVHHGGGSQAYLGSRATVRLVAFYSDCHHEVLPVRSGHRITLTYNLLLHGDAEGPLPPRPVPFQIAEQVEEQVEEADVAAAARHLVDHFTRPRPRRYRSGEDGPAQRLVYLLDHEYTLHGLDRSRLKGVDAGRAGLLRAAAAQAGCDVALALVELHETWDVEDDDYYGSRYRRRRRYEEEEERDADGHRVTDLLDSSVTLTYWSDLQGAWAQDVKLDVDDTELCASTPNDSLQPYASDYEGYMGNYGNTLDRRYRRAAVVVWPRDLGIAVRGQASPGWALEQLLELAAAGDVKQAEAVAASLAQTWEHLVRTGLPGGQRARTVDAALLAAAGLDDAPLARMLLAPFALEDLTPGRAAPLAALTARYGEEWTGLLLRDWAQTPSWGGALHSHRDRPAWLAALPALGEALRAQGPAGEGTARLLLDLLWRDLVTSTRSLLARPTPSARQRLAALAPSVAVLLEAVAVVGDGRLRDTVAAYCQAQDDVTALLLPVLRTLAGLDPDRRDGAGFTALARVAVHQVQARLARPQRADGDWSLELPAGCACDLCTTLGAFLRDPARASLEWPLAEAGRRHVESRIQQAELPVQHVTRASGRPYSLVLTTSRSLFDAGRAEAAADRNDLEWLARALDRP